MTPLRGMELGECVPDSNSELILDIDSIAVPHSPHGCQGRPRACVGFVSQMKRWRTWGQSLGEVDCGQLAASFGSAKISSRPFLFELCFPSRCFSVAITGHPNTATVHR